MSPDLNHSIALHTAAMQSWWKEPEYIHARKAFVLRHPVCARCGRPSSTPGHSHEHYRDYATYLSAVVNDECDPLCSTCNRMERSGRIPCPSCVKRHASDPEHHIHYILPSWERCRFCDPAYNPEDVRTKKRKNIRLRKALGRKQYNRLHPTVKIVSPSTGKWISVER